MKVEYITPKIVAIAVNVACLTSGSNSAGGSDTTGGGGGSDDDDFSRTNLFDDVWND